MKEQETILYSLSTIEAEYVIYFATTQDVVWLKSFLYHLKTIKSASNPMIIYYENTAAIVVAKDPKYHGKTKHIKMRYHYIREAIIEHDVISKHISINCIIADLLIKPIARDAFVRHVRSFGQCRM